MSLSSLKKHFGRISIEHCVGAGGDDPNVYVTEPQKGTSEGHLVG